MDTSDPGTMVCRIKMAVGDRIANLLMERHYNS